MIFDKSTVQREDIDTKRIDLSKKQMKLIAQMRKDKENGTLIKNIIKEETYLPIYDNNRFPKYDEIKAFQSNDGNCWCYGYNILKMDGETTGRKRMFQLGWEMDNLCLEMTEYQITLPRENTETYFFVTKYEGCYYIVRDVNEMQRIAELQGIN